MGDERIEQTLTSEQRRGQGTPFLSKGPKKDWIPHPYGPIASVFGSDHTPLHCIWDSTKSRSYKNG